MGTLAAKCDLKIVGEVIYLQFEAWQVSYSQLFADESSDSEISSHETKIMCWKRIKLPKSRRE